MPITSVPYAQEESRSCDSPVPMMPQKPDDDSIQLRNSITSLSDTSPDSSESTPPREANTSTIRARYHLNDGIRRYFDDTTGETTGYDFFRLDQDQYSQLRESLRLTTLTNVKTLCGYGGTCFNIVANTLFIFWTLENFPFTIPYVEVDYNLVLGIGALFSTFFAINTYHANTRTKISKMFVAEDGVRKLLKAPSENPKSLELFESIRRDLEEQLREKQVEHEIKLNAALKELETNTVLLKAEVIKLQRQNAQVVEAELANQRVTRVGRGTNDPEAGAAHSPTGTRSPSESDSDHSATETDHARESLLPSHPSPRVNSPAMMTSDHPEDASPDLPETTLVATPEVSLDALVKRANVLRKRIHCLRSRDELDTTLQISFYISKKEFQEVNSDNFRAALTFLANEYHPFTILHDQFEATLERVNSDRNGTAEVQPVTAEPESPSSTEKSRVHPSKILICRSPGALPIDSSTQRLSPDRLPSHRNGYTTPPRLPRVASRTTPLATIVSDQLPITAAAASQQPLFTKHIEFARQETTLLDYLKASFYIFATEVVPTMQICFKGIEAMMTMPVIGTSDASPGVLLFGFVVVGLLGLMIGILKSYMNFTLKAARSIREMKYAGTMRSKMRMQYGLLASLLAMPVWDQSLSVVYYSCDGYRFSLDDFTENVIDKVSSNGEHVFEWQLPTWAIVVSGGIFAICMAMQCHYTQNKSAARKRANKQIDTVLSENVAANETLKVESNPRSSTKQDIAPRLTDQHRDTLLANLPPTTDPTYWTRLMIFLTCCQNKCASTTVQTTTPTVRDLYRRQPLTRYSLEDYLNVYSIFFDSITFGIGALFSISSAAAKFLTAVLDHDTNDHWEPMISYLIGIAGGIAIFLTFKEFGKELQDEERNFVAEQCKSATAMRKTFCSFILSLATLGYRDFVQYDYVLPELFTANDNSNTQHGEIIAQSPYNFWRACCSNNPDNHLQTNEQRAKNIQDRAAAYQRHAQLLRASLP